MNTFRLKRFLMRGGIIAYPTESCFGLGCDPKNIRAIKKIIQIKKRSKNKNFIIIASELNYLKKIIRPLKGDKKSLMLSKWPGPHTWLLKAHKNCPYWLKKSDKVAVRIPGLKNCNTLLASIKMSITSTSANKSGQHAIKKYRNASRLFAGAGVKVIKGKIGVNNKSSTIQDFETQLIIRK